ncbi:ccr4-not core complex subunit [Apiospora rasikravindrae]|uniref:poly(A)-specific ribonuclease n=1 Tax=Apiospora rasikravindrae TaxID=990691 RepID=A0ABR1T5N3_9PEZI
MPPQPPSRFQNGPPTISPYTHQFPSHPSQTHQPPSLAAQGYLTNPQLSAFGAANGIGLGSGMGANAGFGVGGDQTGLNSHAARMGFAHAAQLQQQQHPHQQSHVMGGDHSTRQAGNKSRIRDVWRSNMDDEIGLLRELIDDYQYVAMDTEFPGIVGRPMGNFIDKSDYHYQTLRVNVDMLKIIQVGIALFNEKGETPPSKPTQEMLQKRPYIRKYFATHGNLPIAWQFNFRFDINKDMANQSSIESLREAGIDFDRLEREGIVSNEFATLMTTSGLVGLEEVKWLSFHGGYDFGYFTKCLMDQELPNDGTRFDHLMKIWFPTTYDVKHLMKYAIKLHSLGRLTPNDPSAGDILQQFEQKSGLESTAASMKIKRVGTAHQAASDSLLTGKIFFQIREKIFNGDISADHVGKIWGLSVGGTMQLPLFTAKDMANEKENNALSQQGNGGTATNGPSTPSTASVNLVTTPAAAQSHNTNGNNFHAMTPGNGVGVFGAFGSYLQGR